MAFTPAEVSGFIRDSRGKLELAQQYVDGIAMGKMSVLGLPPDDPAFQSPIDPKLVTQLNTKIHDLFIEVSTMLAKVASAIDDGIQPVEVAVPVDPLP